VKQWYLVQVSAVGTMAAMRLEPLYRVEFVYQGVIETEDGATAMFDWRGYGRDGPTGTASNS
jgi:hypothetical protein